MSRFLTSGICMAAGTLLTIGAFSAHGSEQQLQEKMKKIDQMLEKDQNDAAAKLLEDPALNKYPRAYYLRGLIALRKDQLDKAVPLLDQGCKMNDINCLFILGVMYKQGYGVKADLERGFTLLKKAADLSDHSEAVRLTGEMLILGQGTAKDEAAGEKYLLRSAGKVDYSEQHSGNIVAQILLGMFYKEKKDYEKAYEYLEMAAYGKMAAAWRNLAVLYSSGNGLAEPNQLWARLCLEAAERIEPSGENQFDIAMLYFCEGEYEKGMEWMKKSAASKHQAASEALASEAKIKEFKAIAEHAQAEKKKEKSSGLQAAVNNHFNSMKKHLGVNGKEVLAQLNDEILPQSTKGFLHQKINKKYYLPVWTFDKEAAQEYVNSHLISDRDDSMSWMAEEFYACPLANNLLFPNPTIRAINTSYQEKLEKFFADKKFKLLPENEVMKIVKSINAENWREDAENSIWDLGDNYYFHILVDYSGRWNLRSYSLLKRKNNVYQELGSFDTPPDAHQIAALLGALQKDPASLNNLAVDMEIGAIDSVFSQSEEAELIFKMLADQGHATATLNLVTFYRNRDNKEEAEKYLKRAEELLKKTPATAK